MFSRICGSPPENCLQTAERWAKQGKQTAVATTKSVIDRTKAGLDYVATNYSEMAEDAVAVLRAGTRLYNLHLLKQREGDPWQNEPFDQNNSVNRASVIAAQVLGIVAVVVGTCIGIAATPLCISVGISAVATTMSTVYSVAACVLGGGYAGTFLFGVAHKVVVLVAWGYNWCAAIPGVSWFVSASANFGGRSLLASIGGVGAKVLVENRIKEVRITTYFRRVIDAMIVVSSFRQVLSLAIRCTGIFACIYAFSWNLGVAQQLVAGGSYMAALKSATFSIPLAFAAKTLYTTGRELRENGYTELPGVDVLHKVLAAVTKISALMATWLAFRWNIWTVQLLLAGSVYKTLFVGSIAVPTALIAYDLHHVSREINREHNYARALWRRGRELLRGVWDAAVYDELAWRPVALDGTYLLRHVTGTLFLAGNQLRPRTDPTEHKPVEGEGLSRLKVLSVGVAAAAGRVLFGTPGAIIFGAWETVRSRRRNYTPMHTVVRQNVIAADSIDKRELLVMAGMSIAYWMSGGLGLMAAAMSLAAPMGIEAIQRWRKRKITKIDSTPPTIENGTGASSHSRADDVDTDIDSTTNAAITTTPEAAQVHKNEDDGVQKSSGAMGFLTNLVFSHWMADPWMDDEDDS